MMASKNSLEEDSYTDPYDVESSDESDGGIHPTVSSYPRSTAHPLIDYVKNEWQTNPKYRDASKSPSPDRFPTGFQILASIVTAPRFRRYIIVYLVLLVTCWLTWKSILAPQMAENEVLVKSLDAKTKERVGGWYGTNALPKFSDIVHMRTLDPSLLPGDERLKAGDRNRRRLIIVGDVHGCKDELDQLMEKVAFSPANGDHLIFTGDMINKGPQSLAVVDFARQHYASCVRGNHEDRILLLRQQMKDSNTLAQPDELDKDTISSGHYSERKLAKQLNDDEADWLEACPVILKLGQIKDMGQVVVVHGGLVPGVDLERQDPSSVMNMRTIDLDTHVPSPSRDGMPWTKIFNKYSSMLYSENKRTVPNPKSRMMTVIYGHDAATGLNIKKYTKGLDSGCVKGGKLTAMVIEDGGKQHTVSVKCSNYFEG
ncbi:hypothetical protein DTO271G3_7360 [Paecilomyces variotii]|nr:hypothetical protein DTO271G3_7360 [Paecilomyces variotii]